MNISSKSGDFVYDFKATPFFEKADMPTEGVNLNFGTDQDSFTDQISDDDWMKAAIAAVFLVTEGAGYGDEL
jgi:hypothetical protein